MIQRVQSVWFLLAALCGFAMAQVPLFVANLANKVVRNLLATESLLLFALTIATAAMAAFCIFLFRKRSLQFKLAILGIFASFGIIALEVWQIESFKSANTLIKGTYYWGGILPFAMVVFFILAAKGVYRDEKLIKSVDRLR